MSGQLGLDPAEISLRGYLETPQNCLTELARKLESLSNNSHSSLFDGYWYGEWVLCTSGLSAEVPRALHWEDNSLGQRDMGSHLNCLRATSEAGQGTKGMKHLLHLGPTEETWMSETDLSRRVVGTVLNWIALVQCKGIFDSGRLY